jgi:serine/threonine-protein kinase
MSNTERLNTALADRYTLEHELGAGGMATVYLAHDVKHNRKVALKVLQPELAAVIGAERFLNEIEVTGNLQHPNILPLYDSGEADTFLYYVMPYIEGESLRDKLNREKQLGVEETVEIAKDVAAALHFAHERGVVHRDIKPENILLQQGKPLVADFGIALAVSKAGGARLTETGMSLGTPHYMSPEQATGDRELDARSDVYSLGAMVYEMLAGDPPHLGGTAQAIVAKILSEDPESVAKRRPSIPGHIDATIRKALDKTPADRFSTTARFAEALVNPQVAPSLPVSADRPAPAGRRAVAGAALGFMAVLALWGWLRPVSSPQAHDATRRFSIRLPDSAPLAIGTGRPAVALTTDGTRLVFVARVAGEHRLLVKDLATDSVLTIAGSEGGTGPFVSGDGRVGFFRRLHFLDARVEGGPARKISAFTPVIRGGSWIDDSTLAIVASPNSGVLRIRFLRTDLDEQTRDPRNWFTPETQPRAWPEVLPGGRAVVYAVAEGDDPNGWQVAVAGDPIVGERILVNGGSNPRYAASGHLVFVRQGALWAVRFDVDRLETRGEPVLVQPGVLTESDGLAHFSLSEDGTLVYAAGAGWEAARRVVWVGRDGSIEPSRLPTGAYTEVALAPDGQRVAVTRAIGSNTDVWVGDLSRGSLAPVTRDPGEDGSPVWSPDGRRLAIATEQFGEPPNVAVVDLLRDSVGLIGEPNSFGAPTDWSRDGRFLLFVAAPARFGRGLMTDVRIRDLEREATTAWLVTESEERNGASSNDGRWIAYVSDESGRQEVYLRHSSGEGTRVPVSTEGGTGCDGFGGLGR